MRLYQETLLSTPAHAAKLTNKQGDFICLLYPYPNERSSWTTRQISEFFRQMNQDDLLDGRAPAFSASYESTYVTLTTLASRGWVNRDVWNRWSLTTGGQKMAEQVGLI